MNLRESFEEREFQELSPYAAHSRNSRGRDRYEPECDIRTVYQRDRDRILHSKAFRRMKDKTQVFLAAQGDHYRTRLTHTLEVSQIARTIARALNLNEDLTEAIRSATISDTRRSAIPGKRRSMRCILGASATRNRAFVSWRFWKRKDRA